MFQPDDDLEGSFIKHIRI